MVYLFLVGLLGSGSKGIEEKKRRGVLSSCKCCTLIDEVVPIICNLYYS